MENKRPVVILDYGSQFLMLIGRHVRECHVPAVILPWDTLAEEIRALDPITVILSGGPASVYMPGAPACDPEIFGLGIPVLGICYGMQLMCKMHGAETGKSAVPECGVMTYTGQPSMILDGLPLIQKVQMTHNDCVFDVPEGFVCVGSTEVTPIAAVENREKRLFGLQFHPEARGSEYGHEFFLHYLKDICGADCTYSIAEFLTERVNEIRKTVGEAKVLLAFSGGSDSSVTAALLCRALPGQVKCVYIDTGLCRDDDEEHAHAVADAVGAEYLCVRAKDSFLSALEGLTDPEDKRRAVGRTYSQVLADVAGNENARVFLAQGTICSDTAESGAGSSDVIKTHHNVGGLHLHPVFCGLVEPFKPLFKDEVRELGGLLGVPEEALARQPFPGSGFAVRISGEITEEKLSTLRAADRIVREEFEKSGVTADRAFCVLTDTMTVGVAGDARTVGRLLVIRAVRTVDCMTCEPANLPWSLLSGISERVTAEVPGVNRVAYDVTGKPPATTEFE